MADTVPLLANTGSAVNAKTHMHKRFPAFIHAAARLGVPAHLEITGDVRSVYSLIDAFRLFRCQACMSGSPALFN